MKVKLDINTWERKEHFNFFNKFEEPFFGVCVNVDCPNAYKFAKENGISFFLCYLYQSLAAANIIDPFKYRIEGDEVFIYKWIDAGCTIGRDNGTFGYGHLFYKPSLGDFIEAANQEVERVQNSTELTRPAANNIIRCSSLPWIDFTSMSHARMFAVKDSCPKISFGKMTGAAGKKSMPLSIHVHHALVDGLHVGLYIDCFQDLMNSTPFFGM